jgi:hydrogenase/urease accessory protein HupE
MRLLAIIVALAAGLFALPASAHDSRPLFVKLVEGSDGTITVRFMAPSAVDIFNAPRVTLAEPCEELSRVAGNPRRQMAVYRCAMSDARLKIEWPAFNPSLSALVRVAYADGETRTAILDPAQTEFVVPAPEDFVGVAKSYFVIGVEHILGGIDHLLFLAGLLIIAGTPSRTLYTVTGFTLSHSVTLALVALGYLQVSVPAVEAVIALSIVFLATEIARGDKTTLAWRRPILVATAFGLAHGAGFAAALGEIGLPKRETVAALLFFNVGVEAGQLAVIATVFAAGVAIARLSPPVGALGSLGLVQRTAGYALGVVSAYWFAERLAALFAVA